MQTLTKKEWIAVILAVAIIIIFLGTRFFNSGTEVETSIDINSINLQNEPALATTTAATTTKTSINVNNMDQNAKSTVVASISGLIIKDVKVGTGATAKAGDVVSVHYTGKFADGKVFDSSISRGQPIEFVLGIGQVIKGWDEGLKGMKVGGKRTFEISPNLAYGASGVPGAIPVNATLFFEVELVGVRAQ